MSSVVIGRQFPGLPNNWRLMIAVSGQKITGWCLACGMTSVF